MEYCDSLERTIDLTFNVAALLVATLAFCASLSAAIDANKSAKEAWRSNELSRLSDRLAILSMISKLLNSGELADFTHPLNLPLNDEQRSDIDSQLSTISSIRSNLYMFPADQHWLEEMCSRVKRHYLKIISLSSSVATYTSELSKKDATALAEDATAIYEYEHKVKELKAKITSIAG